MIWCYFLYLISQSISSEENIFSKLSPLAGNHRTVSHLLRKPTFYFLCMFDQIYILSFAHSGEIKDSSKCIDTWQKLDVYNREQNSDLVVFRPKFSSTNRLFNCSLVNNCKKCSSYMSSMQFWKTVTKVLSSLSNIGTYNNHCDLDKALRPIKLNRNSELFCWEHLFNHTRVNDT